MWHVDLWLLVDGLDRWTQTDENIARLVDREDYWLNSEYTTWVTDPDDPETKRAREQMKARRRAGYRPPPTPLLSPVAVRPADVTEQIIEELLAEQAKYGFDSEPKDKKITIAELRAMRRK